MGADAGQNLISGRGHRRIASQDTKDPGIVLGPGLFVIRAPAELRERDPSGNVTTGQTDNLIEGRPPFNDLAVPGLPERHHPGLQGMLADHASTGILAHSLRTSGSLTRSSCTPERPAYPDSRQFLQPIGTNIFSSFVGKSVGR